jgi:cell wall-associated NlpC family hydrolase
MVTLPGLLLVATFAGACATSRAVPRPVPRPAGPAARDRRDVSGRALARTALAFEGTPYRAAGSDPSGFDCSGLVQYVFAQYGVAVPRTVQSQFRAGDPIRAGRIQPGDLVFFRVDARDVSHVGIAVGAGRFVHAPSHRGTVRVESLDAPYWAARYAGARRVIE